MTLEEIKQLLENDKNETKKRIHEFVDKGWNYSKLQTKLDYINFLISKISKEEDQPCFDEE